MLSTKEKWNLFFRNFSLCESRNYFIGFVVMVATGWIIGSIVFGFLSDIFGRRFVIRFTLGIITLMTLSFAFFSYGMDNYYKKLYKEFDRDNKYKHKSRAYDAFSLTSQSLTIIYIQTDSAQGIGYY